MDGAAPCPTGARSNAGEALYYGAVAGVSLGDLYGGGIVHHLASWYSTTRWTAVALVMLTVVLPPHAGSLFLFDFHWSSVNVLMLFDTGVCMTLVLSVLPCNVWPWPLPATLLC